MFFPLEPKDFKTQADDGLIAQQERRGREERKQIYRDHPQDARRCARCSREMNNMPKCCEQGHVLHRVERKRKAKG